MVAVLLRCMMKSWSKWIYRYENQGETVTLADGRRLLLVV